MALLVVASIAHGAAVGPFAGLSGAWAGPGTVTLAGGTQENIRCRANYNVDGSGANLKLDLRCSSDSFKFELQSTVSHNNGEVSGFWNEATNRVGGTWPARLRATRSRCGRGSALGQIADEHQRRPAVDVDPVAGQQGVRGRDRR